MPVSKYDFIYQTEITLPVPLEDVFQFFSQSENLQTLTPPWLDFKINTRLPIEMKTGTLIDYQLRLYKIPIRWKTEITEWNPPYKFADTQLKGPYKKWVHEHIFVEKDGVCLIIDKVNYQVPGWILSPLINHLFVKRDIKRIFDFRHKKILQHFGSTDYKII